MNNLDKQYTALLQDILDNGVKKGDRTGTGTISVFGRTIRHKMSEGFPLLTTKRMAWNNIVSELLWFLQGRTDLRYLLEHNNQIWVGDAHKAYCNHFSDDNKEPSKEARESFIERIKTDDKFSKKWGDLGPIYGKQWRSWTNYTGDEIQETVYEMTNEPIDQIANLIKDLKENPDSRRLMVNSWNPAEIDQMTLPPCHYGFQCYTRELNIDERINLIKSKEDDKLIIASCENPADEHLAGLVNSMLCKHNIPTRALSLQWNQRSVDTPLGLPFNIASYGLLLEILAKICNMVPDELIGNLGDTHIYNNQVEGCIEQIGREMTLEERRQLARANGLCPKYPFEIEDNKPIPNKWTESEWYDRYRVPTRTREPFQLPTLKHMKTDAFWKSFDVTLFGHLDPKDFQLENYQSHPTIKFPLSN